MGSDGAGYVVSDNENITDTFTDGDGGGDTYDDPYTASDTTVGTDVGSDSYTDSDKGSESDTISATGTLNSLGAFILNGFTANIGDNTTSNSSDGGIDNDSDPTDNSASKDNYSDSSQGVKGNQTVELVNTGGATSNSTCNTTMSGPFISTNTDTGNASDSTSSGSDKSNDTQQDKDQATIQVTQLGSVDSSGNLALTGGQGEVDGTDQFNQNDSVNAATFENCNQSNQVSADPPPDELVMDDDLSNGTDKFDIECGETGGSLTSLKDQEKINDTVKDTVNVIPIGTSGTDVGYAQLGGSMNAMISQSGNSDSGAFQLAPESGNDQVKLNGQYKDTKVVVTTGIDPSTGYPFPSTALPASNFPWYADGNILITMGATNATVTTQLNDTGIVIDESDTDNAGQVGIGAITYKDNPVAVTKAVVTYANTNYVPSWATVTTSGTTTDTNTQSEKESVSGGGPEYQTNLTTKDEDTIVGDEMMSWSEYGATETGTFHSSTTTTSEHSITGTQGGTATTTLVDKTMDSSLFSFNGLATYSNTPGMNLISWTQSSSIGSNSKDSTEEVQSETDGKVTDTVTSVTSNGSDNTVGFFHATQLNGPYTSHGEAKDKTSESLINGTPTETATGSEIQKRQWHKSTDWTIE